MSKSKPRKLLEITQNNIYNIPSFYLFDVFIVIPELGWICSTYLSLVGFTLNVNVAFMKYFCVFVCVCIKK